MNFPSGGSGQPRKRTEAWARLSELIPDFDLLKADLRIVELIYHHNGSVNFRGLPDIEEAMEPWGRIIAELLQIFKALRPARERDDLILELEELRQHYEEVREEGLLRVGDHSPTLNIVPMIGHIENIQALADTYSPAA